MPVTIDLPADIEQDLRGRFGDLNQTAKEAFLVELYRERKITHYQLSAALGLSRYDTDGVLKRHGVMLEITAEEFQEELASLRDLVKK